MSLKKNNIADDQSKAELLDMLTGFSWLYQRAKICLGVQFTLTVFGAGCLVVIANLLPGARMWTTFAAITIALLDALLLERVQSDFRTKAARVQELFDTSLLNIPWSELPAGGRPTRLDYADANRKFRQVNPDIKRLEAWYPPVVAEVPHALGRSICQRMNCWWDASLRKKYGNALYLILGALVLFAVSMALMNGFSVEKLLTTIYLPIAPAVLWIVREARKQHKASDLLVRTEQAVVREWSRMLNTGLNQSTDDLQARIVQDIIFDGRSKNPPVFDWIYFRFRGEQQLGMEEGAAQLVAEAKRRGY